MGVWRHPGGGGIPSAFPSVVLLFVFHVTVSASNTSGQRAQRQIPLPEWNASLDPPSLQHPVEFRGSYWGAGPSAAVTSRNSGQTRAADEAAQHGQSHLAGRAGGADDRANNEMSGRGGGGGLVDFQCPSLKENSACPCYKFDDGLVLECPSTTAFSLRTTLQVIKAPIQSLSIYDFDNSVTTLTPEIFGQTKLPIRHLQFSQSSLQRVADESLRGISSSLESLSIVSGKLQKVPQKAIQGMNRLSTIDLEANEISKVEEESFSGLPLSKLNLKTNQISNLPPDAFKGVESTLADVDLSDNKLQAFPMLVLRKLENIRSLRLATNEMSALLWDGLTRLPALQFLDLSSNKFTELGENFFLPFAKLRTLNLYSNQLNLIHYKALQCLKDLVTLDLSHNHLVSLDHALFVGNWKLQTIDLSHNHLHYVDDLFKNLPNLKEVFLNENNILEMSKDAFTNSTKITNVYVENNALRHVDDHLLDSLEQLQQLHMTNNFLRSIPVDFFKATTEMTSLSLDGNWLVAIEAGVFYSLKKLKELRLNGNTIERIHLGVFHPLPALTELHLQDNWIKVIDPEAFVSLRSLILLNLRNNNLKRIDFTLPVGSLSSILLDSNVINSVSESIFQQQQQLQILSMGDNQMMTLDRRLFSELSLLEELHLPNNSIERIHEETFQELINLKVLDMQNNLLTEVKRGFFSPHLVNLEELILQGNRIQTVEPRSFDNLRKMKTLDLSGNFLTTLTKDMFQGGLEINTLALKRSTISHIEPGTFRDLKQLYELHLEGNQLKAEDVRQIQVPSLRLLNVADNNQMVLSGDSQSLKGIFDQLPSLQILRMDNCGVEELPEQIFKRNTNLVRIDLSDNLLRFLPRNLFVGLNVLKELRLNRNQFSDFPHQPLHNMKALEAIFLKGNQLMNMDFSKINGVPSLRHLDLSVNHISSLSGFSGMNVTQLETVDLSGNSLQSLPSNFFLNSMNLRKIELSSNRFLSIPSNALGDHSLARLTWLNLSGNPLGVFFDLQATPKIGNFSFLKELHISHANLSIVTSQDFQGFPSLEKLQMTHNRINRLSPGCFNGLKILLSLDISVNELEKIHTERLQGLGLLRILNVSHNVLKDLDDFPGDLKNLRSLDLSFNQLSKLGKSTLRHLVSLTELNLQGNRLKSISGEAFRSLQLLQHLDLSENYFEKIPLAAVQVVETQLKMLLLGGNPIQCHCDTLELWEWLRDHLKLILRPRDHSETSQSNQKGDNFTAEILQSYSGHLRCDQPANLRGHVLLQMKPQSFCDVPMIVKLAIQDIQPYSLNVTWQSGQPSGLEAYRVVYRSSKSREEVHSVTLDRLATFLTLSRLAPGTQYEVCVVGVASSFMGDVHHEEKPRELNSFEELLGNHLTSRCEKVFTLNSDLSFVIEEHGLVDSSFLQSLVTRRLGLLVGCFLGIIVFFVLVSVLGWLKVKKQRLIEETKRMAPNQPDFATYQPYSISQDDDHLVLQTGVSIGQNDLLGYPQKQRVGAAGGVTAVGYDAVMQQMVNGGWDVECKGDGGIKQCS